MRRFWLFGALLGLVVFALSWMYFSEHRKHDAEARLLDTVNYVKVQCGVYANYNEAAESQALLRLVESARQVSRNLDMETKGGQAVDEDMLARHTRGFWLSGIVLLDENGDIVNEYHSRQGFAQLLQPTLEKSAALDTAKYPEKIYGHRIDLPSGGYIDMAACGRIDQKGVVAVYYYTPSQYALMYNLTVQNILSGYNASKDGTILVSNDGVVIASNDRSLIGSNTDELPGVQALKDSKDSHHMMYVESRNAYGVMLKQRDYYIFAYLPYATVWGPFTQNMAIVMFFYFIALGVAWALLTHSQAEHRKQEQEKEALYHEEIMAAAKKAQAANRSKTEFLQRMSHDIRTPINGIIGMIEVADHYKDDMEKQAECRQKIRGASTLLLELVNEVLDMGKLESGKIILDEKPFQLKEMLDEITAVIEKLAAEQGLTCTKELVDITHWRYVGSVSHLKRLLLNIMSNAVKYNKEKGSIHLSCEEIPIDNDYSELVFTCADTGIGMSEEYQKKIFEPFTREDEAIQTAYGGTGLGMPIAKSLVEKMGGTISFTSELGVGTTFTVNIPFAICKDEEKDKAAEGAENEPKIQGLHVLLAEDNELNMEISEFIVENEGGIVTKAWNGQEAVDIFRKSEEGYFDVILMDMMMPVMDGCEAAKTIRAMDRVDAKTVPIIAMTANAFSEDREKTKASGMDAHLSKPLKPELVADTIAHLTAGKNI